jgi:hypothetical protein
MRRFRSLTDFYNSDEWRDFRAVVIAERLTPDGLTLDEVTGKPIVKAYDIILHHVTELTEENVNDVNISLNPKNIQIVSHKTHNIIHNKLGYSCRQVYIVYGAPLSGKTSYVKDSANEGDLIIDIDNIWQCVSGCDRYVKPNRLKSTVFRVRDTLLDVVKYRAGKWNNAYIIGGYPLQSERERLVKELGARLIYIDCPKDICIQRLEQDGERGEEWRGFIEEWYVKAGV